MNRFYMQAMYVTKVNDYHITRILGELKHLQVNKGQSVWANIFI